MEDRIRAPQDLAPHLLKKEVEVIGRILKGRIITEEAMIHKSRRQRLFKLLNRMRLKNRSCLSILRRKKFKVIELSQRRKRPKMLQDLLIGKHR